MSGSTGAERVKSRKDYTQFINSYTKVIKGLGCEVHPTGSFISDKSKDSFGDIDIIVEFPGGDKKTIKKQLIGFLTPLDCIVEFTSNKYKGRRYLNTGEIITVRYHDTELGYSVQIDNIISVSKQETTFKQFFLNLPAEKQGLLSGLMKTVVIEHPETLYLKALDLEPLLNNQEYEFNISSNELQLRKVTYQEYSFIVEKKEVVWQSQDVRMVKQILQGYDFDKSFEDILNDIKKNLLSHRSYMRLKGVFKSIVTVKSGEVDTVKGITKLHALSLVEKL